MRGYGDGFTPDRAIGLHLDEPSLRRARLDYWPAVDWRRHTSLSEFEKAIAAARVFCFSARATHGYTQISYQEEDCLLFGGESRGLPASLLQQHPDRTVCIPMPAGQVRSLNLATAVGIALYEALRQLRSW